MATRKGVARAGASFALVGDDGSVTAFTDALAQSQTQATQLSSSLTQFKSDLDEIIQVLTYPETVSNDLNSLGTVLTTASELLTAVELIPEIGEVVAVIQEAVTSLQAEITPAQDAATAIDNEVQPVRDALSKLDSLLADAIQGANDIASAAQTFLANFQSIDSCINAMPDGTLKTQGLDYLSSFASTTTPYVNVLNTALTAVNGAVSDFYSAVSNIENQLSFLSEISGAIESVLSELSPILGPLKSLDSLLDTSITIPTPVPFYGVHVSIRDILTDFQAFTDLAMSILAPILDPILEPLQQLAQSIISQIPGLSQLLNLNITIPSIPDFASLFGNLTSLLTSLESALQLFTLTCPPSANQPTFAAQIDDHMKDVAGYFGQGTAHVIQLGRGRHLTAAKGKIAISKEPIGRASLFRATLDVSKRVVLTAVSSRKILAIENGEFVLKKGPVTPASHLKIIPTGKGKFSLAARDEQPVEVGRTSAFSADRH